MSKFDIERTLAYIVVNQETREVAAVEMTHIAAQIKCDDLNASKPPTVKKYGGWLPMAQELIDEFTMCATCYQPLYTHGTEPCPKAKR
jgi:hypothetical protein